MALSETNRLGIVLYDQSLSESQKVVNVSVAQPDKGADDDDDDDRLVSWQLVKECEDMAEFVVVSQGKQVKVLQLSIAFAGRCRLSFFFFPPFLSSRVCILVFCFLNSSGIPMT